MNENKTKYFQINANFGSIFSFTIYMILYRTIYLIIFIYILKQEAC